MGIDWEALRHQAARGDVDKIKSALPIPFVLEQHGLFVDEKGQGKYATPCPFHDDSDPSLDVFGENLGRWGCYPCGIGGDVLDLIQRIEGYSNFADVMKRGEELLAQFGESDWKGPTVGKARVFDFEKARANVAASEVYAEESGLASLVAFLDSKRDTAPRLANLSAQWLWDVWRIGARDDSIVIPYYNREGELVTYKWRTPATKPIAYSGSSFNGMLYGEWLDTDPKKPVLLCEGESDVWAASGVYSGYFAVLGLPTGVGTPPKAAESLAGRTVYIAFDGDVAGRMGARRWWAALSVQGCDVRVATLPEGTDIASVDDLRYFVDNARAVSSPPEGIMDGPNGESYLRPAKKEDGAAYSLSSWGLDLERAIVTSGGSAYEGVLRPANRRVTIRPEDLDSTKSLRKWCRQFDGAWEGNDLDVQRLLRLYQSRAPFLAPGRAVEIAGLNEGRFVWPGGSIGSDYWSYLPPAADVHLEERLDLRPGPWDDRVVPILRALHERKVMDPILAWLAAAPIRSLLPVFPVLAVTGSSRSGKTTMLDTVLRHFSGVTGNVNLTSTTQYALFGFIGSTNAFPQWFDEFRPGARRDTMDTFKQVLRDAWNAAKSAKGGMGATWGEIKSLPMIAPIIVSGEDAFDETSHVDRLILVSMPSRGKNPTALAALAELGHTGFPRFYLEWLQEQIATRTFVIKPHEDDRLNTRQQDAVGVLDLGWSLLSEFLEPAGIILDAPDWSLIIQEADEANSTDPIREALLWSLDEVSSGEYIARQEGDIIVRTQNLVQAARAAGFSLPGGVKAVSKYLRDKYGAREAMRSLFGKRARVLVFPESALVPSDE